MRTVVAKTIGWCLFVSGLAATATGVVELLVEVVVGGLISASTSGLVLLKMRAEALGRMVESVETPAQPMIGSSAA